MWWLLLACADEETATELVESTVPCLVADPILDLGVIEPGGIASGSVVLENGCGGTLLVEDVALDDPNGPFGFLVPPAIELDAGERIGIAVDFLPRDSGEFEGRLRVSTNDPTRPTAEILLQGVGLGADVDVPSSVAVDPTWVGCEGQATVTVRNLGTTVLDVTGARIEGDGAFGVASSVPFRVFAGESADVVVTFAPEDAGEAHGALILETSDPDRPEITVALSATGGLYELTQETHTVRWVGTTYVILVVNDSEGAEGDHDKLVDGLPSLIDGLNRGNPFVGLVLPASSTSFVGNGARFEYPVGGELEDFLNPPAGSGSPDGLQHAYEASLTRMEDLGDLMGEPDDALTLIFLALPEDHGSVPVAEAVSTWEGLVDDPLFGLRVHALVSDGTCGEEGARYAEAAVATRGIFRSACDVDWGPALEEIGRRAVWDGRTFPTRLAALPDTVSVTVDGAPAEFDWDAEIGAVVLASGPEERSTVVVEYAQPPICD